jgi:hypothetical protein
MMAGTSASACNLQAEFSGAFTRDMGEARILVGWQPVSALLAGKATMGAKPDVTAFDGDKTVPVMILTPFATNAAQRPKIKVYIVGGVAEISSQKNLFAFGAAVLNHPFWVGVFDADCQLDLRVLKGG